MAYCEDRWPNLCHARIKGADVKCCTPMCTRHARTLTASQSHCIGVCLVSSMDSYASSFVANIAAMADNGVTTFSVGGTLFTTSRETLFREPSSRLALIAKNAVPCVKDTNGAYFIDRDGKHFQAREPAQQV